MVFTRRPSVAEHLAVPHGEDVVGERFGEGGLVGGHEDGAAATAEDGPSAEVGEELDHVLSGGGVEVGEGLVEEEEFGVGLEDAGEGSALTHALRVLADGTIEAGIEADRAEGHLGAADAGAAAGAVESGEVSEVFHCGEFVVEHGGVAHVSHAAALLVRRLREDGDAAAGGGDEARDDAKEGRFARAIFAEDDGAGACGEGRRDIAECGEAAVDLGDGVEMDCIGEGGGAGCGCGRHFLWHFVRRFFGPHASIWLVVA